MATSSVMPDAMEAVLARNRALQREVRELRAALARVEAVLGHAGKVSTSSKMAIYVSEVREALKLR